MNNCRMIRGTMFASRVRQAGMRKVQPILMRTSNSHIKKHVTTVSTQLINIPLPVPLLTKGQFAKAVLVIAASMGVGDYLCQAIKKHSIIVNFERTATMAFIGLAITGPLSQAFNFIIEKRIPGTTMQNILSKVVISSIWSFTVSMPLVFSATVILQKDSLGNRGTFAKAVEKIQHDLVPTFLFGSLYWPLFNIFMFKFIPLKHRAIFTSIFSTIWNIYLAGAANSTVNTDCSLVNQSDLAKL